MKLGLRRLRARARDVCALARRHLSSFLPRLRGLAAGRWSGIVVRAVLAGAGLVLLALIGRTALVADAHAVEGAPSAAVEVTATGPPQAASSEGAGIRTGPTPLAAPDAGPELTTPSPAVSHARATPDHPVVLNQATFEELRRLPGIGPKKAQSILALRQRIGRFRQVEDLLKVKGIGRSTLKRLRPLVRLDPAMDASVQG